MEISYSLDNQLIFDKEINKKGIIRYMSRIATVTLLIVCFCNTITFAATPFYKKEIRDPAFFFIIERLMECRYADKVVASFEWLNDLPGNVLKSVVDFSYDIEEIIRIYVENKN